MAGFPKPHKAKKPQSGVKLPISDDLIEKLLLEEEGNISRVADRITCSRWTVENRIKGSPHLSMVLAQCRERIIDELEKSAMRRAIDEKDTTLQIFLLKTQGKKRGYDQNEAADTAKAIAAEAFSFILNQSKSPVKQ